MVISPVNKMKYLHNVMKSLRLSQIQSIICAWWELNPRDYLGRVRCYLYITCAQINIVVNLFKNGG